MNRNFFIQPLLSALFFFLLILILGKFFGNFSLSFNTDIDKKTFSVDGVGTVTKTPDQFTTQFSIAETGPTQEAVQQTGNEKQNKALDELKTLGFEQKDIKTDNYAINPQYDYTSATQKTTGYTMNISTTIKSTNKSKIQQAIDKLPTLGVNIGGIRFSYSDDSSYQEEARKKAVEDAHQKAEQLAQAAGLKLGKIAYISEVNTPDGGPLPMAVAAKTLNSDASTTINPGTSDVTQTINVTYYFSN